MRLTEASSATQALRAGAEQSSWLVSPRSASWKREWGCLLAGLPGLAGWRGKHNQESEAAVSFSNITDYLRVWGLPRDLEIIVILPCLMVAKAWPCYVLRRANKWMKKPPFFLGVNSLCCRNGGGCFCFLHKQRVCKIQVLPIPLLSDALLSSAEGVSKLCWGNSWYRFISSAEQHSSRSQNHVVPSCTSYPIGRSPPLQLRSP